MLVCSVVLRPQRHTIAAAVVELGQAVDEQSIGAIFATLTDDPGNARDIINAFTGQNLTEAATATDTLDAESTHPAVVLEEISAAVATHDAAIDAATIWATWEPAMVSNVTLSGGNLIATNTAKTPANQGASVAAAHAKTTGKYYFEATFITITGGANLGVGVGTTASTYTGLGGSATTGNNGLRTGTIWANGASTGISVGAYSNGQIAGVSVDLDNRKIWFRHSPSGNWNNNASYNPATNTGGITIPAGTMVPFNTFGGSGGVANNVVAANFGASAFAGAVPSGFTAGWPTGLDVIAGAVAETATANSTQDGTVVPGAVFATWDTTTTSNVTLSGGNLVTTNTVAGVCGARVATALGKTTGKYYFEIVLTTVIGTGGGDSGFGVGTTASTYSGMAGSATTGVVAYHSGGGIWANGGASGVSVGVGGVNTRYGVAVDLVNRKIWFRNGNSSLWNNNASYNPATNVGGVTIPAGTMVPFNTFGGSGIGTGNVFTTNFGASTFVGAVPSGFTAGWPG